MTLEVPIVLAVLASMVLNASVVLALPTILMVLLMAPGELNVSKAMSAPKMPVVSLVLDAPTEPW